ncbi:MAG: hypothetical protein KAT71_05140 [Gammaproteobacteria bacterium]|nr:hypothetical protein [Gammaproteobacteria bacterium]
MFRSKKPAPLKMRLKAALGAAIPKEDDDEGGSSTWSTLFLFILYLMYPMMTIEQGAIHIKTIVGDNNPEILRALAFVIEKHGEHYIQDQLKDWAKKHLKQRSLTKFRLAKSNVSFNDRICYEILTSFLIENSTDEQKERALHLLDTESVIDDYVTRMQEDESKETLTSEEYMALSAKGVEATRYLKTKLGKVTNPNALRGIMFDPNAVLLLSRLITSQLALAPGLITSAMALSPLHAQPKGIVTTAAA